MFNVLLVLVTLQVQAAEPIKICLHRNFPTVYKTAVLETLSYWEGRFTYEGTCTGPNQVPIVWNYKLETDCLAVTSGATNGYKRIDINAKQAFTLALYGEPTKYHFKTVLAHELGHVLGLGHTKTGLMQPVLNPGEVLLYNVKDPNLDQFTRPRQQVPGYLFMEREAEFFY